MSTPAPQFDEETLSEVFTVPLPPVIQLSESQRASLELIAEKENQIIEGAKAQLYALNLRRQLVMREVEVGAGIPEGSLEKYQGAGKELVLIKEGRNDAK